MRIFALIAVSALLGACVMPDRDPVTDPAPPSGQGCDAAQYQRFVGGSVPDPVPYEGPVRVYQTGMALTMDHNPNRLNVETDPASGRVVSVSCG